MSDPHAVLRDGVARAIYLAIDPEIMAAQMTGFEVEETSTFWCQDISNDMHGPWWYA